jgi:hypothetical protein
MTQIFWLVFAGVSIVMFGVTRLTLYSLKMGRRPVLRIVLAHVFAVAIITAVGGFDMPYLAGWIRWSYALALCAFGTAPWLAMDLIRLRLTRGGASTTPPAQHRGPPPP